MQKRFLLMVLLALALISAACAGQQGTDEPGAGTAVPTVSTDEGAPTDEEGDAEITPTGAMEESTATVEAGEADLTPTASAEDSTSAPEAGGTPGIPQTGPGDAGVPDDLQEVMAILRTTGVPAALGDAVTDPAISVPGQILMLNGQELQVFTYATAEELESQASRLADDGNPENEPQYYKLGNMLVRYAGRDTLVRDLLEDVLGAQAAGQ